MTLNMDSEIIAVFKARFSNMMNFLQGTSINIFLTEIPIVSV